MFEQPDALARRARVDRGGARLHIGKRGGIIDKAGRNGPFGRRKRGHRAASAPRGREAQGGGIRAERGWTLGAKPVRFGANPKR